MSRYYSRFMICLILTLLLDHTAAYSQPFLKMKKEDLFTEENGFKEAWLRVKEGDKFFLEGPGSYARALEQYMLAKEYNRYCGPLNFKIGIILLHSDKPWEAQEYLDMAYEFDPALSPDLQYYRARAYQQNLMFDEAISTCKEYRASLDEKKLKKTDAELLKMVAECEAGKDLIQDTVDLRIENLGKIINSPEDDYNPVLSYNGLRMYFTSRRPLDANARRHPLDNKFNEDVYVSYNNNGEWGIADDVGKPLNTDGNESALYISPDNEHMFLYYGKKQGGNIYGTDFHKGKWLNPSPLPAQMNSRSKETTITFNADMNEMYFVSFDEKTSLGGSDIYYSMADEKGKWSKPVNLGREINTSYNEEAVHLTPGGDTLYFSSRGHNSMGGYDVFVSYRENGRWTKAQNLGYPINTPGDDLFYKTSPDTAVVYMSGIRKEGLGWNDIYRIIYLPPPVDTTPVVVELPPPPPPVDTVVLVVRDTIKVVEEVPLPPVDTSVRILGSVMEEGTSSPLTAKLEIIDLDLNKVIATSMSDPSSGNFRIRLEERKNYGIEITAQGYMLFLDIVDIPKNLDESEVFRNFFLKKVKVGETIILKNIFFEYNKATLTPDSYAELARVFKLLTTNPTIRIEVSGHTDNVGSLQANTSLSQARAKAVVDYLIVSGIDPSRLEYKGYAYTQPVAPNDTPEGRAQNRRVEFKILSQ